MQSLIHREVELVAIKGDKIYLQVMPYEEALNKDRKEGFTYIIYQKGFSQYKDVITIK